MPRPISCPSWQNMVVVLLLFILCPSGSWAALLTDTDNKHNMSSNATHGRPSALPTNSGGTDQICIFCHTPHAAAPESTLWSRPEPNPSRAKTFDLYAQPLAIKGDIPGKLDATAPSRSKYVNTDKSAYPNGASRMCLSCHDGATAIGILRDNTTIAMASGMDFVTNYAGHNPVIDLSTSHPISFVYDSSVLTDISNARGPNQYKLPSIVDAVDTPLDGQSRMQCTTCHDPHNDTRLDGATEPFWRQTSSVFLNPYDDVCNACHMASPVGIPPIHSLP